MSLCKELSNLKDRLKWVQRNLDDATKFYQKKDPSAANACVGTASSVLHQAIELHFKEITE